MILFHNLNYDPHIQTEPFNKMEVSGDTKADFVTATVFVKQKRDKFVGVWFGIELEETYRQAFERVENPPTLNIIIPPMPKKKEKSIKEKIEFAPSKVVSETPCYITNENELQYKNRKETVKEETYKIKSYIRCIESLMIYDDKNKKYTFDGEKYKHNFDDLLKTYTYLKAELILRKYDKKMIEHYLNWLLEDKNDNISSEIDGLGFENIKLIDEIKNKFLSSSERLAKKQGIFSNIFWIDLVGTGNVWDIKSRIVVVGISSLQRTKAVKKLGENEYAKKVAEGEISKDIDKDSKVIELGEAILKDTQGNHESKNTLDINVYGKGYYYLNGEIRMKDYYGNYHFGYVGMHYYNHFTDPLGFIIFGAGTAQTLSDLLKLKLSFGDPQEDVDATIDVSNKYLNRNLIV